MIQKQDKLSASYYPSLDGLRAFSVLFVIFEHVLGPKGPLDHFHGWLGVDIFFVLSGFLITTLLVREERQTGSVNIGNFYIRRAFRILPVYFLVLGFYVLGSLPTSHPAKWAQLCAGMPYFLTFNNDLAFELIPSRVGSMFGLSWSLGVEEKFYLLWPVLLFLVCRSRNGRVLNVISFYAGVAGLLLFSFKESRAFHGLLVGCILAFLLTGSTLPAIRKLVGRTPEAAMLLLAVAGFALVDWNIWFVFPFAWIVAALIAYILLRPGWISRGLENSALVWLGKRSYVMYLTSGFALNLVIRLIEPRQPWISVSVALLAFAVAALIAEIIHRTVEEPMRQAGKNVIRKRDSARVRQDELPEVLAMPGIVAVNTGEAVSK